MALYAGVDIGGQTMKVGVGAQGQVICSREVPTPLDFDEACATIVQVARDLLQGEHPPRFGIGCPGPLDWRTGTVLDSTNLPWVNVTFEQVGRELGCEVLLDNDANVAGLGETLYGAGRGKRVSAGFTLGTGIGYFHIIEGHIYHGALDVEAGHQVLDPTGPECNCGQRGCLEAYASATGIKRRFGKEPHEIDDPALWADVAHYLAWGIVNLIVFTSPEVVILGGGMMKSADVFLPLIQEKVRAWLHILPRRPIVPAELGPRAGLVGALALAERGHGGEV